MKFARYLQDTQTPEWKKAYIDYRGLKKRITAIRKADEGPESDTSAVELEEEDNGLENAVPELADVDESLPERDLTHPEHTGQHESTLEETSSQSLPEETRSTTNVEQHHLVSPPVSTGSVSGGELDITTSKEKPPSPDQPQLTFPDERHPPDLVGRVSQVEPRITSRRSCGASFAYPKSLLSLKRQTTGLSFRNDIADGSRATNPLERLPLNELLAQLNSTEKAFFTTLDGQLDKIDSFYAAREKEMAVRTKVLHEQLDELGDHKKLIQSLHSHTPSSWTTGVVVGIKDKLRSESSTKVVDTPHITHGSDVPAQNGSSFFESDESEKGKGRTDTAIDPDVEGEKMKATEVSSGGRRAPLSPDPEDYLHAKKKLKKAVLEHYRGLEVLQNYRILNLTGFRKALKKFEKATRIPAQRQYMEEKVERTVFASGKTVLEMMNAMETLYATRFARGDKKRAIKRLRAGFKFKSHHYSVFRSGIYLGIALPALISGVYASFQQSTRDDIPAWGALLFIYGIILIPVLFILLVGVNLLVWAHARINYVFIFELDTRTRLDYREYYEIPSILLAGLCYAFWLSFNRIGASHISPQTWPLVWLGFCGLIVLEPLPLFSKSSRYWLVKNVAKLLISGTRRVEFTDFWMGDQLCSLVFTLSNFYFFGCVYARHFDASWATCGVSRSPHWPVMFILASLPLMCRLVQSVKRYYDSGLVTHLINGGKYGSGIVSNLFFYMWRQRASQERDSIFALWILFNSLYSIYASTWDFLMDWSVLRLRAQYPLLRQELIYTNSISAYYFAIVTNILVRFIWVIYIPNGGLNMYVRTFITAFLEMLRRWQWNFYRLENEHLGNMDQYRVTREVPLPYSFDEAHSENADDDGDDDDDKTLQLDSARKKVRQRRRTRKITMSKLDR